MQAKPWERYSNAPQSVAPPNPTLPYEVPKAQADVQRAQAQAQTATAQAPYAGPEAAALARKAEADARIAEANAAAEADGRVKQTATTRQDAFKGFQDTRLLDEAIAELEMLYIQGPGATTGFGGAKDFLPIEANKRFDRAGNQVRAFVKGVLQFTGQENNTPAEALMNFGPYVPQSADYDGEIRDKINALKRLRDNGYERAVQGLGGVPNRDGQIVPLPQGALPTRDTVNAILSGEETPNAMTMLRQGGGPEMAHVGRGDAGSQTTRNPNDIPVAMKQEMDDIVARLLSEGGGRLDPQRYAQEAGAVSDKYGFGVSDPAAWAQELNQYFDAGGTTVPSGVIPAERLMSARETMRNNLVSNPIGAAIAGSSNGLSAGTIEAMLPGQMMALRDAQPMATMGGEIAGAVGGTNALARATGALASRAAPRLLQGGGRAQFGRNIAADATYGAIYGQNTQGDPLTGAALGTVGSAAGQGAARGLGSAIGGAQRSAAVEALRARGVPISVGRQLGMGRAEDLAMSVPFVGDAVRGRQMDSFAGFNQAAFQEGGAPIGAAIPNLAGREGVEALDDAVGNAYTNALGGRAVPLDQQFGNDLTGAVSSRMQLPDDIAARADKLIENHINPLEQSGQLTGEMYQRARRGLGKARNNANQIAGEFDEPYRQTMTGVLDAYDGLLMRGGGQDVIEGLTAANAANKNLRILEDASLDRAKVGTQAGDVNVFTPAQLLAATRKSESKYGGGDGLRQLAEQGQEVLPSTVPNSGTADRMMAAGLLGGAGALGGAAGFAGDPTGQGAATGSTAAVGTTASAAALAALLGTRRGQQALEQILFTRPQVAQTVGQGFRRRGGLFGSAGNSMAQQSGY